MYPPGIVTRTCTVGGATAQESGDPLILSVVVASSRGLIWASTGWRLPSLPRTVASTVGSEATFELPVTSQAGFRSDSSPGTIIDVSAPGSYSHTYTATVTITTPTGGLVSQHVIGPFPLPAEDLSPVDLDTMLPVGTVAGGAVLVPDSWDARVAAAEAAVAGKADRAALPASVRDYGAVGDGVADDTAAVQAALTAGDAVSLEPGKTYLVGPLTYSNPGGVIIGNGATIRLGSGAGSLLTISGAGVTVRDLTIDQNSHPANYALDIASNTPGVHVVGCTVKNGYSTGTSALIRIREGCDGAVVDGCHLDGVTSTAVGRGVLVSDIASTGSVAGVKITNNLIENIGPLADGDGVAVQGLTSADVLVEGNTFRRCLKRSVKIMSPGVTIANNTMDHSYNAGVGYGYAALSAYSPRTVITGNRIFGAVATAWIDLLPIAGTLSDVTIAGNIITTDLAARGASCDGISAGPTAIKRASISGNVIYGARHGVRLQNEIKDVTVVGNIFEELTGSAVVIDDNAGTAAANVTIVGNTVRTVANYLLTTDGGNAPASLVEVGNAGEPGFGLFGSNVYAGLANRTAAPMTPAKTAGYTQAFADDIILMNGASVTLSLRPATSQQKGRVVRVKNLHSTALTVSGNGTNIDGGATATLAQWAAARYVSDGTQWLSI